MGGRAEAGRESDLSISLWGSWDELNQHVHQSEQPHIHLLQSAAEEEQLLAIRRSMRSITAEPITIRSPAYRNPRFSWRLRRRTCGVCFGLIGTCHPIIEPQNQKRCISKMTSFLSSDHITVLTAQGGSEAVWLDQGSIWCL